MVMADSAGELWLLHSYHYVDACRTLQYGYWGVIEFMAMRNDDFKSKYGFHNALLGWADITGTLISLWS
jgi:hypothetical protein